MIISFYDEFCEWIEVAVSCVQDDFFGVAPDSPPDYHAVASDTCTIDGIEFATPQWLQDYVSQAF